MKLVIILIMLLILTSHIRADHSSSSQTYNNPLLESEVLEKNGNYLAAEKLLSRMIASAQHQIGSDLNTNITIAVGEYTISLSYLYLSRAGCWRSLGEFDKALADYTRSYYLKENYSLLYFIADCMYEQGMYSEAIRKFDEYLGWANLDKKERFLASYGKALAIFKNGAPDQAIQYLEKMKTEFPEFEISIQNTISQCVREKKELVNISTNEEDKAQPKDLESK